MQNNDPSKSRVLYLDLVQDENYELLEKIADLIIKKFIEKGITTDKEIGHVRLNPRTQCYEQKFHVTALRSAMRKTLDATELLSEYQYTAFGT